MKDKIRFYDHFYLFSNNWYEPRTRKSNEVEDSLLSKESCTKSVLACYDGEKRITLGMSSGLVILALENKGA